MFQQLVQQWQQTFSVSAQAAASVGFSQGAGMAYAHTVHAAERLIALGADVTAYVIPFVGHEITDETMQLVIERPTTHVPKSYFCAD